jgi:hypothetical protein
MAPYVDEAERFDDTNPTRFLRTRNSPGDRPPPRPSDGRIVPGDTEM